MLLCVSLECSLNLRLFLRREVADRNREAAFMGVDMILRLRGIINRFSAASSAAGGKKTQ